MSLCQFLNKYTIVDMFSLEMDFSLLQLTIQVSPSMWYCSEKSILAEQIKDTINLWYFNTTYIEFIQ